MAASVPSSAIRHLYFPKREDEMNFRDIPMWDSIIKAGAHRDTGHAPFWQQTMSRRNFARTAAGTAVVGATLGSGLWKSEARPLASTDPVPIPGGIQDSGKTFHVFSPGPRHPDGEPITITDFNGFVGLAYISGMVTETNTKTGKSRRLPFLSADMRFMQGVFRDKEGRVQQGAFALV
jgi:hypothetical protein